MGSNRIKKRFTTPEKSISQPKKHLPRQAMATNLYRMGQSYIRIVFSPVPHPMRKSKSAVQCPFCSVQVIVETGFSVTLMKRWLATFGFTRLLLPVVFYACVAVFITWPLATQLTTHTVGFENPDSFANIRLGWWAGYALQHGLNPFYQSLFGYPDGFFSSIQWSQPLVYWPMTLIGFVTGPVAAFNLSLLLVMILNG